jgi:oligosaccharide translocation protein RFT1
VLSQITLRLVDPTVLGKASIRLDLMLSTVLFLGREGFRLALIKSTTIAAAAASRGSANYTENIHISNVAWLSIYRYCIILILPCSPFVPLPVVER